MGLSCEIFQCDNKLTSENSEHDANMLLNNKEIIFWDQSHNNSPKILFQKEIYYTYYSQN